MTETRFAARAARQGAVDHAGPSSMIRLGGGSAFPDLLPDVSAEAARAAKSFRTEALQYGPLFGLEELRQEVVRFLAQDGVQASTGNILILNGAKQALDLSLRVLIEPGDMVIVSRPTYLSALAIIRNHEAEMLEVELDENGMKVDELEAALENLRRSGRRLPKLLFEVPDFHNPTGTTLSEGRRRKLVRLAEEYGFLILEDDPYRRLRFGGQPVPPIKCFDAVGRVIGAGTFSKILAPGMRIGWANADPDIIARMAALKSEGGCCPLTQLIALDLLREGRVDDHIRDLTPVMRTHRDAMTAAFREYLPEARFTTPQGGYFLWVELPEGADGDVVAAAAERDGVAVFPGRLSNPQGAPSNFIRLAYSFCDERQIREGVRRLSRVVRDVKGSAGTRGRQPLRSLAEQHHD